MVTLYCINDHKVEEVEFDTEPGYRGRHPFYGGATLFDSAAEAHARLVEWAESIVDSARANIDQAKLELARAEEQLSEGLADLDRRKADATVGRALPCVDPDGTREFYLSRAAARKRFEPPARTDSEESK